MSGGGGHLRILRVCAAATVVVVGAGLVAACGGSGEQSQRDAGLPVPQAPRPVQVAADRQTILDLGNGAKLIIPAGAMKAGATVRATYQNRPSGNWGNLTPIAAPVKLISDPPDAIHGLLILEFPATSQGIVGVNPAAAFGISTYNPATGQWIPFASSYDAVRHMVIARIPHFSWWNPFTWDFTALFARVAQDFGQLTGARAGPASCVGGAPAWVGSLAGITNTVDIAVRSCVQSQGGILDVEMVNNRPYGQILTYGSGVKWGWHQGGSSAADAARNHFMDHQMGPGELYLPPLARASVGIFPTSPGSNTVFKITPTRLSVGADLFFYVLGKVISAFPSFGKCESSGLDAPLTDVSPGSLRDDLTAVAKCAEQAFTAAVASGALDKVTVSKLAAILAQIKDASLLGDGIELAGGVTWKVGDIVADWAVNHNSSLGNGFSVYAKARSAAPPAQSNSAPSSASPPNSGSSATAPGNTAPAAPATFAETVGGNAHTWTNYADAGGDEGATIRAYTTVQVSCRIQGFRVQDGDTWWYRIASAPWSNNFYVSADAFYNNGHTSGSLIGTPFVDSKVPDC